MSTDEQQRSLRQRNLRLALVLATIAAVSAFGFVAKIMALG